MKTTMPPPVQNQMTASARTPKPRGAAQSKAEFPSPTDSKPDATGFRKELTRQRKEKSKVRMSAESGKPAAKPARAKPAKPARAAKGKPAADQAPHTAAAAGEIATISPEASNAVSDAPDESVTATTPDAASAAAATEAVATGATQPAAVVDPEHADENVEAAPLVAAELSAPIDSADEGADALTSPGDDLELPNQAAPASTTPRSQPSSPTKPVAVDSLVRPPPVMKAGQSEGDPPAKDDPSAQLPVIPESDEAIADATLPAADDAPGVAARPVHTLTGSPAIDLVPGHSDPAGAHSTAAPSAALEDTTPPELRFAAANHENIVKSMRAEVLPNGGSMRLRLDPPQLGALQVTVQMRDGLVTAAFETSNDDATRLLGHSLNQLKTVLESHGVAVEKLQVQQAPRDERPQTARDDDSGRREQSPHDQDHAARQEQQRRQMLQKMWRRLAGVADPLDVTG
jgi:flagellar hook-length control protein FliK